MRCLDAIAPSHAGLFLLDEIGAMSDQEEADSRIDVAFLHRSYCIAGLPTREPRQPTAVYAKSDGRFALTVHPTTISLPSGDLCDVGVPWGAKARLLILWAASEINEQGRSPDDPWLEIGAINEFLEKVGIPKGGKSVTATKEQLIRLAFSSFTMILKGEDEGNYFTNNRLFSAGAFHDEDLEHYREGNLQNVRWPMALKLSAEASKQFRSNAIPIPAGRLALVSHNPTAIDLLVYLCYRLPLLGPNSTEMVNWRALNTQFGAQQAVAKFREAFAPAIRAVRAAYPEANFETTSEGLVLRYSDPAVLRRSYIAVSKPSDTRKRRKTRNRYDNLEAPKQKERKEQIVMDL
jgi:hypothetical protein